MTKILTDVTFSRANHRHDRGGGQHLRDSSSGTAKVNFGGMVVGTRYHIWKDGIPMQDSCAQLQWGLSPSSQLNTMS